MPMFIDYLAVQRPWQDRGLLGRQVAKGATAVGLVALTALALQVPDNAHPAARADAMAGNAETTPPSLVVGAPVVPSAQGVKGDSAQPAVTAPGSSVRVPSNAPGELGVVVAPNPKSKPMPARDAPRPEPLFIPQPLPEADAGPRRPVGGAFGEDTPAASGEAPPAPADEPMAGVLGAGPTQTPAGAGSATVRELVAQYFPAAEVERAMQVSWCESSHRNVTSAPNSNGSRDHGIFQINDGGTFQGLAKDMGDDPADVALALDPQWNVRAAALLHSQRGWQPWTCAKVVGIL